MSRAMTAPNRCTVPGSPCRLQQLDQPGPRPGWAALDAAGQRRLTGSLTLHLSPDVTVWFHDGRALHAERDGEPTVEQVLLDAGVVTADQLARGVIALGPVRNLGRLFDRVPELDPDVVELAVELATAELLGEIADRVADAVTVEPYHLHPSGLHHWAERTHEPPLDAAAQRVRERALEPTTEPVPAHPHIVPDDRTTITPEVPAPSAPVEDDANVAVVTTPATTRPVDEPVVDRAVVDAFTSGATPDATAGIQPTAGPPPEVDPHPVVDLRRVIEEIAAETAAGTTDATPPVFGAGLPVDDPGEVPDDVRAAVRMALAEIAAATRPSVTDGLTVAALLDDPADQDHGHRGDGHRAEAHRIEHEHAVSDQSAEDHHGLRRLLGGRHA